MKGLILNDYGGDKNYATMVWEGIKKIETRMGRLFTYRGDVVICKGKTNSVGENRGKALCLVNIWKGRDMLKTDEDAARIEWHPKRKSLLMSDWRHFSELWDFSPNAMQRNFQGMFDIIIPDGIEIIPRPDILPYPEGTLHLFNP